MVSDLKSFGTDTNPIEEELVSVLLSKLRLGKINKIWKNKN